MTFLIGVLCYAGAMWCAYLIGFLAARQRISDAVFRPWLTAQGQNNGPVYWLRARDYAAAWRAYDTANLPFLRGHFSEARSFTDAPDFPVVVEFAPEARAAYERKSHDSTTSARHVS